MKAKKLKRRNPTAQQVVDPNGPYRPKIIQTKPRYPIVADEMDDWYFSDMNGGVHETNDS